MTFDGTNLFVLAHHRRCTMMRLMTHATTPQNHQEEDKGSISEMRGRTPENVVRGTANDPVYNGTLPMTLKRRRKEKKPTIFVGVIEVTLR